MPGGFLNKKRFLNLREDSSEERGFWLIKKDFWHLDGHQMAEIVL